MLFLIQRTDPVDYDEYDAIVMRAATAEEAIDSVFNETSDRTYYGFVSEPRNFTCELIDPDGESGEVLASFNAG